MKKVILITVLSFAIAAVALFGTKYVFAEQSGSSNESGATSYIKATYDSIVALGHGSVAAGAWGDWGAYWNRIRSAAEWVPSSNATVTDVKFSKTFNNTSRTQATGTYPNPTSCSSQVHHDSFGDGASAACVSTANSNNNLIWTTASPAVTGDDASGGGNQDPRTGLIWSKNLQNSAGTVVFADTAGSTWTWDGSTTFTITAGSATAGATYTNNTQTFTVVTTISNGTSLNTTGTGLPSASGTLTYVAGGGANTSNLTFSAYTGTNAAVGNKTATLLCSERGNGWRLPGQKELMQVYIDGSNFKLSNPSNSFWSITENSAAGAWSVNLSFGSTNSYVKATYAVYVRCVR